MTIWEFLSKIQQHLPLFLITPTVTAAVILFLVGFSRRGLNFFKFGFGNLPSIPLNVATKEDIERIEKNHFAHLNKFLDLLCSILQDKNIITNTESLQLKETLKD